MVREIERVRQFGGESTQPNDTRQNSQFPETAPAANPVFFRTYSRRGLETPRETWDQVCDRTLIGLIELGKLTTQEAALIDRMQRSLKSLPSGRWLWVGGSEWISDPVNFSGAYNCTSTNVLDWRSFGLMMDLAMMGCGTGAVLEPKYINQLPPIRNRLLVTVQNEIGTTPALLRREETEIKIEVTNGLESDSSHASSLKQGNPARGLAPQAPPHSAPVTLDVNAGLASVTLYVGDSRQGWIKSYQTLLELSSDEGFLGPVQVNIDLSDVRPTGETLKGFGGVANPVKLPELYCTIASILNKAVGRKLNSIECCLLIDAAAVTIVAGNIRRSAGIRQGDSDDDLFANAKANLWQQDDSGNWRIDPERDALRMANHTRVFHHKPTMSECIEAVRQQYYSGEGAIQWAGEAVARANCDKLPTQQLKAEFLQAYDQGVARTWLQEHYPLLPDEELEHRLGRYGLNPCGK